MDENCTSNSAIPREWNQSMNIEKPNPWLLGAIVIGFVAAMALAMAAVRLVTAPFPM